MLFTKRNLNVIIVQKLKRSIMYPSIKITAFEAIVEVFSLFG